MLSLSLSIYIYICMYIYIYIHSVCIYICIYSVAVLPLLARSTSLRRSTRSACSTTRATSSRGGPSCQTPYVLVINKHKQTQTISMIPKLINTHYTKRRLVMSHQNPGALIEGSMDMFAGGVCAQGYANLLDLHFLMDPA